MNKKEIINEISNIQKDIYAQHKEAAKKWAEHTKEKDMGKFMAFESGFSTTYDNWQIYKKLAKLKKDLKK